MPPKESDKMKKREREREREPAESYILYLVAIVKREETGAHARMHALRCERLPKHQILSAAQPQEEADAVPSVRGLDNGGRLVLER